MASLNEVFVMLIIGGKTDKIGDESIVKMAQIFDVSTDFLLGVVNEPERKNYDISELGLSVKAAQNQMYDTIGEMISGNRPALHDAKALIRWI